MAHIVYGGQRFQLTSEEAADLRPLIVEAMSTPGGTREITLTDADGDTSHIYLGAGIPVVINSWDSPTL